MKKIIIALALMFAAAPAAAQTSMFQPTPTASLVIQGRARAKAAGAMGNPRNIAWDFDEFMHTAGGTTVPMGWASSFVSSGTGALNATDESAGVEQLNSGATASSTAAIFTNAATILRMDTAPFYFACRFKVTSAVDAQTTIFCGTQAISGSKTVAVGVFGASSTANYVLQYDGIVTGSFLSLGVAIDTAYHIFEVWGTGDGKLHVSIDFGADKGPVTQASAPTVASYMLLQVQNGTTATARTARYDYVAVLAKRN